MNNLQLFLENFHFLRPLLLLGLIPALILGLLLLFSHAQGSLWARAVDPKLLPFLLDKSIHSRQSLHLYGLLLIWALSVIALAGPVWKEIPMPVQEREDALVVVMDLSLSMYSTDLNPNRLTRAQRKLQDILSQRSAEGQTALVVYAGDAHAVTPLTNDVSTIRNMVTALQPDIMPQLGSKPDTGIRLGMELLDNAGIERGRLLLITDGISQADKNSITDLLSDNKHSLSLLGVGTSEGAPIPTGEDGFLRDDNNSIVIPKLDHRILESLADETGGRYSEARLNDSDIEYLLRQNLLEENENLTETEREFDTWYEAGPWLLLLVLPFAALAFRRGWLLLIVLAVFMVPSKPALAVTWGELWQNKDQRGSEAFEQEEYADAASQFDDARWRAASQYRQGNFAEAAEELATFDDVESHYNRGNALARDLKLDDALAAYDAALAIDPEHADALHNRAIVEDMLEQQQDSDMQNSEGDNQEQQEQDQQQDGQQGEQNQDQQQSQEQNEQQGEQNQDSEGQQDQQEQSEQEQQSEEQREQERQRQEAMRQEARETDPEEEQSMQQWLGRIKDDPGELLRNKFRQQTQQRLFEEMRTPDSGNESTGEQIW